MLTIVLEEKVLANKYVNWDYDVYGIIVDGINVGHIVYRYGTYEQLKYAGHIGYHIDEEYRHHHYAYEALKLLLAKLDEECVMISCEADNIASKKTIEKCHVLKKEHILNIDDEEYQCENGLLRYWIKV